MRKLFLLKAEAKLCTEIRKDVFNVSLQRFGIAALEGHPCNRLDPPLRGAAFDRAMAAARLRGLGAVAVKDG